MSLVHLVRHGRAAAGWDTDLDPGLDDLGTEQAIEVGERLRPLGPLAVVSSPLRRCRETAAPLAAAWGGAVRIEPAVAEIPSPAGVAMADRVEWLRGAMAGTWGELGATYTAFRDQVVAAVVAMASQTAADAVVFSHFVAINAVIGAAVGDDRLVIRSLDNCSVTVVEVLDGRLQLVEGGHEADTLIR